MKTAYKMADGRKIEGRRVVVDVERGRTVPNWWVSFCADNIQRPSFLQPKGPSLTSLELS